MLEKTLNKIIEDTIKRERGKIAPKSFKLFKEPTKEEKKEAYNKAKDETLKKFPSMYKFFDFIEQRLGECREESDLTSDFKGERKVDD